MITWKSYSRFCYILYRLYEHIVKNKPKTPITDEDILSSFIYFKSRYNKEKYKVVHLTKTTVWLMSKSKVKEDMSIKYIRSWGTYVSRPDLTKLENFGSFVPITKAEYDKD